jgi:hypothetical protein
MDQYKPNSFKYKEGPKEPVPEKKIEKVVSAVVKPKKKSGIQKFTDVFISEDIHSVKNFILQDVLIPAIKKAVVDTVTNGIKMLINGTPASDPRSTNASRVAYVNYYERPGDRVDYRRSQFRQESSYDNLVIPSLEEARNVLARMDELIESYKVVSVADLYDLCGVTGHYTDNNYGWADIRNADIVPVNGGYMIRLPRAMSLK